MGNAYLNNKGIPQHVLGNYVYLNWENYQQAGTRNIWTKEQESRPLISNFNSNIFLAHKANTLNAISKYKVNNIKQLEQQYNASVKDRNDAMKKLFNNKRQDFVTLMTILLESMGGRYKEKAAELAAIIQWDPNHDRPFAASKFSNLDLDTIPTPPPITFKVIDGPNKRGRGQCAPRIAFCTNMLEYIKRVNKGKGNEDSEQLVTILQTLTKIQTSYRQARAILDPKQVAYELNHNQALYIDNQLKQIRANYIDVQKLNQDLWAAWAEFTGNVIMADLDSLVWSKLRQAMEVGKTSTQKQFGSDTGLMSLNLDLSNVISYLQRKEQQAIQAQAKAVKPKSLSSITKSAKMLMNFETLGTAVQNKRDIVTTIDGEQYGISMKNTNLAAQVNIDEELSAHQIPHVSLQNSSLALYLMGIEAQQEALGTHYLNILASHPDENGTFTTMRKQANTALTLYILYSAMTGEGQLRKQPAVNLFAVYDKAKKNGAHRVKLFDMASLIIAAAQKPFSLQPTIDSLTLDNTFEENSSETANDGVGLRLTKVLIDARTTNIEARIENSLLQNIYNNRYKS